MKLLKSFFIMPFTLLALAGCATNPVPDGGIILTDLDDVKIGDEVVVALAPNSGYCVESFNVDSKDETSNIVGLTYRTKKTSNNMKITASFKKNNFKDATDNLRQKVNKAKQAAKEGQISQYKSDIFYYKYEKSSCEGRSHQNGYKYQSEEEGNYFVIENIEELTNSKFKQKFAKYNDKFYSISNESRNGGPVVYHEPYEGAQENSNINGNGEYTFDYCLNPLFYALNGEWGATKIFASQQGNNFFYEAKFVHGEGKNKERTCFQGSVIFDDQDRIISMYQDCYVKELDNKKTSKVCVPASGNNDIEYQEKNLWNYCRAEYTYGDTLVEPEEDKMLTVAEVLELKNQEK